MKRIYDINGYFAQPGEVFNSADSWEGAIILNKDNTFEGMVKDNYKEYDIENYDYVFGKITDKKLDLIKTTKEKAGLPYHYVVESTENSYRGEYSVTVGDNNFLLGEAKINLLEADKIREVTKKEEKKLETMIEFLKINLDTETEKLIETYVHKKIKRANSK